MAVKEEKVEVTGEVTEALRNGIYRVVLEGGRHEVLAYTAGKIQAKASFASEFAAVTDIRLNEEDLRHRFVRDTLREVGIEAIPVDGFAVWVAKLKPMIQ